MERHVDAGHQDEGPLAAGDLATPLDLFLERLQTADGAGDGVLRAAQVEVHDLQELAGARRDFGHEVLTSASSRSICDGRIAASR